ncbi:MAG: adenylate kinase [Candidatus Aenigmarchaeota archaeon]|nr:adenylate kinase [Candidatus Aenigmarchaeota archaeon]
MKIIFLGMPGSGKGTQAKMTTEKYAIPHISTGDMFRQISKENNVLGKKIKSLIDNGILVSDVITFDVLKNRLEKTDCKNGFILDGYPRNINQAKLLDKLTKIDFIIYIALSDKTVIKRLTSRRTCKQCGAIYNIIYNQPKKQGICDKCGNELYQREDETEETIKKRLVVYKNETEPLVNYYKQKGMLREIKGEQDIGKIFEDIVKILSKE